MRKELTEHRFGVFMQFSVKSPLLFMALSNDERPEDAGECPVCYESLSDSERTLSCGHVFCHDCLVKTLVSIHRNGDTRNTIVCPICRHLTFIKRQKEALVTLAAHKHPDEGQTLEVPLPLRPGQSAQRASRNRFQSGVNWMVHGFRSVFQRIRPVRLISPSQNACQIFIISAQGRPMAEEDALDVVVTVVHPQRRRRRICTTARCLLILLLAFTLLALVAATLPWILLA
uniref:Ring finger protein 222 n=1 Tax=Iconisemion striatum TaxID=60296 RepID=A0A1A7XSW9_9TELE